MAIPQGSNQRWSLDFVSDSLSCGRRFRILNVIDDFSRECLAAVVDTSLSGIRVARELDRIAEMRGKLRIHLADFMATYNFARRPKTLNGLVPYEYICKIWTSEPDRFILNPIHQMPGLNT